MICPTCHGTRTVTTRVPNVKRSNGVEYVSSIQPTKVRVDVCPTCKGAGGLKDTALIDLGNGDVAIIDSEDEDVVAQYSWHLVPEPYRDNLKYAAAWGKDADKTVKVRMHRLILNPPDNMQVDHINGNGLDNRKANLRLCTAAQNLQNRPAQANNQSGFKGVSRCTATGRWKAGISINGKDIWLGRHDTAEDAARAYDAAARLHHGEFAHLNFPTGTVDDLDPTWQRTAAASLIDSDRANAD